MPGSSEDGILQARILEWVAISSSRGSSQPRNRTWVSCIAGRFFTDWATREALKKADEHQEMMLSNCGVGQDTWESLGLQGNQLWIFTGRTRAEAEAPVLWPPDAKSWLNGKDPDTGKDWRQEAKGRDRGWDGWMASPTQWMWVEANLGKE